MAERKYDTFTYKDSKFRIASDRYDTVTGAIVRERGSIESYIEKYPVFRTSFESIEVSGDAPEIVRVMAFAGALASVGPMAAVAGAIAERAAAAALREGGTEAVIGNGGDIFIVSQGEVVVGLYPGSGPLGTALAFLVRPSGMPLAVCSSSSTMGHSISFGNCDLATVVSKSGALADAAATFACNAVKHEEDIGPALDATMAIEGVLGVLLVKGKKVGLAGTLPEIVRNMDPALADKITRF
jgi:ApbE superfamily uncharacterized protein (UPF0280 family)